LVCLAVSTAVADVTIDLSTAEFDQESGHFCVLQKVCIANPPESLTSAGCAPSFPPGCDCDPEADNPNESCPVETECVQCKCLPLGCDCDPQAEDPNSFCPAGDICKDCQCQSPLPPGCECDVESLDPDYLCPGDLRCVGCKCQDCPQSGGQGLGQGRAGGQVKNPPLVFVIDTTKSVKPDKDSIFNLTSKVTGRIMKDKINIPQFQLFTFNDYGREINRNVRLELDTPDVREFDRATSSLVFESYNGGRDSKERMSQGLLVALQNATPKSLIVVFTDNGSKDLNLEKEIIRLRKAKEIEVFIVLTPAYEGKFNGPSLPSYGRMGKVFLINEVGADSFLRNVEEFEETNCI